VTLTLDTNVFIELLRDRRAPVRRWFSAALASEEPLVASLVVFHELRLGCFLHHDPAAELARVRFALARVAVEPLNQRDVVAAASVRAALRRQGQSIGPLAGLIAGQALARDWTLVTANRREFDRIVGLNVIDWAVAAD